MTAAVAIEPERLPFCLRDGTADDHAFVMDSWLLEEKEASGHIERGHFVRWQKRMQRDALARPSSRLVVACPPDDPSTIIGWLLFADTRPRVVHYVFVRFPARRLGVARMLLDGLSSEPEIIYAARPARVSEGGRWIANPVTARIPSTWRHMPRAAFFDP